MGFLSGPITWDCHRIRESPLRQFGLEQIKILQRFAAGQNQTSSLEEADVGFLAGEHLFDARFALEKNVIGDALHCAIRIDTNQIPSAVRRAWLQMELAAAAADNPSGRPTKVQPRRPKRPSPHAARTKAQSGKFRKMQQFPLLWDARKDLLYFGGSSSNAAEQCCDLCVRAFDLELERLTAGRRAQTVGHGREAAENARGHSARHVPSRRCSGRDRLVEP